MLDQADLKKTLSKEEYKMKAPEVKEQMGILQQTIKKSRLPVIVLFEGWGAAGKGSMISHLILTLDPRGFKVYSMATANEAERRKPLMWRYWDTIPEEGNFSIYDRSWYQELFISAVEDDLSREEMEQRIHNINTFERQLTDNGYLIVKFFLHISQKEQKERLDALAANKATAWRVSEHDLKRNRQYNRYYKVIDQMLARTNPGYAPWHIVPCHDRHTAQMQILDALISSINLCISGKKPKPPASPALTAVQEDGPYAPRRFQLLAMPRLKDIPLNQTVTDEEYDEQLHKAQKKLSKLHSQLYREKIPVIMAFEGWDAAGKGGTIRRVAAALDPRGYEVIPISAPTKPELAHHYLWRFWKHIPKTGHIAIFDRTWYGRVLVERIEGFCTVDAWQRAYQEINEFEYELHKWGAVILKFWLQIDKDEQLRRFTDRQNTPSKRWKITDEDWRNREKWDSYEQAVDEMLIRSSTNFAPWHIIQSQNKKFGRLQTLQIVIDALEAKLGK